MWVGKRQATGGEEGKSLWWIALLLKQMEAELGVGLGADGGGAG
jgi:hypothetical protein